MSRGNAPGLKMTPRPNCGAARTFIPMKETIAVACRNASGAPTFASYELDFTPEDMADGLHYDRAEAMAEADGYCPPFLSFDHTEASEIKRAAEELGLLPSLVAVDLTDGVIHSVTCDRGEIDVVIYDQNTLDLDEDSPNLRSLPVGPDGIDVAVEAILFTATEEDTAALIGNAIRSPAANGSGPTGQASS